MAAAGHQDSSGKVVTTSLSVCKFVLLVVTTLSLLITQFGVEATFGALLFGVLCFVLVSPQLFLLCHLLVSWVTVMLVTIIPKLLCQLHGFAVMTPNFTPCLQSGIYRCFQNHHKSWLNTENTEASGTNVTWKQ